MPCPLITYSTTRLLFDKLDTYIPSSHVFADTAETQPCREKQINLSTDWIMSCNYGTQTCIIDTRKLIILALLSLWEIDSHCQSIEFSNPFENWVWLSRGVKWVYAYDLLNEFVQCFFLLFIIKYTIALEQITETTVKVPANYHRSHNGHHQVVS